MAHRSGGGELGALLGLLEEVWVERPRVGGPPRPHSHNAPVVPRGAGRAGPAVSQMEGALEAQLNRRALRCCARFKGLPHHGAQ